MLHYEITEDLITGVEFIDDQHRELFKRLNQLLNAADRRSSIKEMQGFILFVRKYIEEHLSAEENLMRKHAYPEAEQHILEHGVFRTNYQLIIEAFNEEQITVEQLIESLQTEVGNWFVNHIKKTDQSTMRWLKDKV